MGLLVLRVASKTVQQFYSESLIGTELLRLELLLVINLLLNYVPNAKM